MARSVIHAVKTVEAALLKVVEEPPEHGAFPTGQGDMHEPPRCRKFEVRVYDGRVLREDRTDVPRNVLVDLKARLDEDQVGTLPLGGDRRHRRSDAKLARLITRGGDDPALARSADGDRLSAQLGIIALLDRCIEGVHVDMNDLALPR
jgi:hypothetical protein